MKADETRLLRSMSTLAVLQVLRQGDPVSRAEIAAVTGLTAATVSNVVSTLVDCRMVREVGLGPSNGGRPPVLLEFDPRAFCLAGVDLGVSKIIAVVTDLQGSLVSRVKVDLDNRVDKEGIVDRMFDAVSEALSQAGAAGADAGAGAGAGTGARVAGIGISVPGLTDAVNGVSVFAPNIPSWYNVPIVDLFKRRFGLPSWVENDARAMTLGEARFGAGRGCRNLIGVNVGRGVGAGLILNGELYRGQRGGAGEIGHTTIDPDGPVCPCGNNGCLEVLASGPAIAAAAIRAVSTGVGTRIRDLVGGRIENITAEVVSEAANEGDVLARRLLAEAGRCLGIGIANAVNLFSPEMVVIGGGVSRSGELLFEEIRSTVRKRAFTTMVNLPEIVPSALGEDASGIGAAALVLEVMLETGEFVDRARAFV
ncbi:MAG: ROK family transcriptional regulator [Bacillota bacterium]